MRRRIVLLAATVALGWHGAAVAAETVAVRAAPHPGYGRIVFDGPHTIAATAKLDGRTLIVHFKNPITAKVARIASGLPDYIARVALSADGRTLRATLKGAYRLRSFGDSGKAVFDLLATSPSARLPANESAKPAAKPSATAAAVRAAAPTVAVRTGVHAGYGRLVFDWRAPVGVHVDEKDGTATVRFDRPARVDLKRLRAHLPAPVSGVSTAPGAGLALVLRVPPAARLRHFTNGTSVVVDVLTPAASQLAAAPRPSREAKAVPAVHLPKPPPAPRPSAPASVTPPAQPAVAPPTRLFPALPSAAVQRRQIAHAADGPTGAGLVSVDVVHGRDVQAFRFNWRRPVAAVVFRRRAEVWVIFDAAARVDIPALAVLGKPVVSAPAQVPVVGGTAVRFDLDPAYRLRVREEGTVWVVEALPGASGPAKPIPVLPQGSIAGGDAHIVFPVPNPGPVLRLHDPDVGDMVEVVPLADSGRGVAADHRFVDATILQSAQGIAVHPLADGVTVAVGPDGVTVARPGGMRLSSLADRVRAERMPPPPLERMFDFADWARGPGKTPALSREILTRAAAAAPPAGRTDARLRLAHYFVAHDFGAEALGVLAQVARQAPARAATVEFHALRGAAYYLAGEYGMASADLGIPTLASNIEAGPWRGAIAAKRGDWRTAQREFASLASVMDTYPRWLATQFGLLAAEASLAVGDTGTAQSRLEVLAHRGLTGGERDMLEVLQGYYMKDTGNTDGALAMWRTVAAHGDRRASARARFALADTLYDRKKITLDQVIDRMERLRFAWRGDVFEFDLLRRLAALYEKRDDSRDALETLKEAATYFHNVGGVDLVAQEMAAMFRHLFADGGADKLPPVTALALFDEFRELTPPGAEGDAMVRKLAERLVGVDLLGEAAGLLDRQVKFRLKGVAKARVGARLAQVRLLDNKPKDALAALAESDAPNLPADVAETRRLARAGALAALGKRTDALLALAGDSSLDAERLRAAMAWRAKDWPVAAAAFGLLIARTDPPPPPDERARLVLSRAVALALAGDAADLAALRDAEGAAMKKTKYADAFEAVVGPPSPDSLNAALKLGDIGAVEAMLGKDKRTPVPAAAKTAIN